MNAHQSAVFVLSDKPNDQFSFSTDTMTTSDAQAAMVRDYDRLTDAIESTVCKAIKQAQDSAFAIGKEVAEAKISDLCIALRQIELNAALYTSETIREIAGAALSRAMQ